MHTLYAYYCVIDHSVARRQRVGKRLSCNSLFFNIFKILKKSKIKKIKKRLLLVKNANNSFEFYNKNLGKGGNRVE